MAGTAFDDVTDLAFDDSKLHMASCISLHGSEQVGSRVNYEGKLVYFDPEPREVPVRSISQSPRKKNRVEVDVPAANLVCNLLLVDNTGQVMATLWGNMAS